MPNSKPSLLLKVIALSALLAGPLLELHTTPGQAEELKNELKTEQVQTSEITGSKTTETGTNPSKNEGSNKTTASTQEETDEDNDSTAVSLEIKTDVEDLDPTDNVELAKQQVSRYPDSPEASFILAVALTRTSRVEEALKEVRRARKLAEAQGGVTYFDKMIDSYEKMLKNFPEENRVRYGLAWAYYMKAYLLANYSQKVASWKALSAKQAAAQAAVHTNATETPANNTTTAPGTAANAAATNTATANAAAVNTVAAGTAATATGTTTTSTATDKTTTNAGTADNNPAQTAVMSALGFNNGNSLDKLVKTKLPTPIDKAEPQDIPQIKQYYQLALKHLDDLLLKKPDDIWAAIYRAHLLAEYTGDISGSMKIWTEWRDKCPNNPAPYFFLGEGYLKQGNLKESLNNVSRAIALRAMGF